MPVIDKIAPSVPFVNNETQSSLKEPKGITHKLQIKLAKEINLKDENWKNKCSKRLCKKLES